MAPPLPPPVDVTVSEATMVAAATAAPTHAPGLPVVRVEPQLLDYPFLLMDHLAFKLLNLLHLGVKFGFHVANDAPLIIQPGPKA